MAVDIKSPTLQNLEAAFAGECMAHAKYRYFAKICRAAGDEETAKVFEATANQNFSLRSAIHSIVAHPEFGRK